MAAHYSDQIIEEVRRSNSLIELVGERTPVKQSGRNFQACCPFHTEKTPSFQINEEEGLYYCFGCGKKGNTYTFVMETKSISFPEAVRFLAQRASISLPIENQQNYSEKNFLKGKNILRKIVSEVANFYEENLWKGDNIARQFLSDRKINDYTAKRFRVGYAMSNQGCESLSALVYKKLKSEITCSHEDVVEGLISLGLLRKRQSGNLGELFWERVMFPITKSDASPLAFGGRIFKNVENSPKYINSPESPVFEKRRSFFGMGQGFSPAQKQKQVYIVEGYLDVISFSQLGIDNTLAVCGTALTLDHVKILRRFVNKVVLIFDGDGAGRAAAARAFVPFLDSGIEVVPVMLPNGEDPDTLTYNRSEEEVKELLKSMEGSLLRLNLETMAGGLRGLNRGEGVALENIGASEAGRIAQELAKMLAVVKNTVELELRIREACGYLGITENSLTKLVNENRKETSSEIENRPVPQKINVSINKVMKQEEAPKEVSHSRRISILRRQLLITMIVEPSILLSSSVRAQLATLGVMDQSVNLLAKKLIDGKIDEVDLKEDSEIKVISGLSKILVSSVEERDEILARFSGILTECSLASEGLLEEAMNQLALGEVSFSSPDNRKKNQIRLVEEFSNIVDKVLISDELDVLRKKEIEETDVDGRLRLAQEKLMRKRSLSKANK